MAYIGNNAKFTRRSVDTFTATASQTTFVIIGGYSPQYVDVFLNGVRLTPSDYTATDGTNVVLAVGATEGDIVEVITTIGLSLANVYTQAESDAKYTFAPTITVTATSKTIEANEFVNVTAATQTITLPASPSVGDTVKIGVGNFVDTVIGRNGSNIMSTAEDMTIDTANATVALTYIDASIGWRVY